jgi:GH43 family beta-xylosidase
LENDNEDPFQGEFQFRGQLTDATNKWAIDGTVF